MVRPAVDGVGDGLLSQSMGTGGAMECNPAGPVERDNRYGDAVI